MKGVSKIIMKRALILFLALTVAAFMGLGCEEPPPPEEEKEEEEEVEEDEKEEDVAEGVEIDVEGLVAADMDLEDGTYEASAEGHEGDITLEITIEDGEIVDIGNFDHQETEDLSDPAFEEMPDRIIDAGGTEGVDGVTEVTVSSEAIARAVEEALYKAAGEEVEDEDEEAKEEDEEVEEEVEGETFTGTGEGFNDDIEVEVTMDGDEIVSIEVLSQDETPEYWEDGKQTIDDIIDAQGTDVDTETGATASSDGIVEAVEDAIN